MDEDVDPMVKKLIRFILYFFKVSLRVLVKLLKQVAGMFIFALLAAMEMGDWTGLLARYGNPEKDAAALGITTQASSSHLLVMIILSISIVLAALITVLGFFQDGKWIIRASQLTGVLFALYGAYQVYTALTLVTKSQENLVLAGAVYIIIGAAVFGLGSKFVHSPKPAQQQTSH
jgi:hypothetical protein